MLKRKFTYLLVIFLLVSVIVTFAQSQRDCKDCGTNCDAGSCDISYSCGQCYIYDCYSPTQGYFHLDCGYKEGGPILPE